jgi:hypothetical protein
MRVNPDKNGKRIQDEQKQQLEFPFLKLSTAKNTAAIS